ncbi:HalOD1 output domain-containing protein [Halomicrococcus sp. SG-WS-1]|uniref:HalOD1 output domain-containing protein n=1 Tax=Halomicrococcus sp. SG-WS-1 TaxID=3439057 RepID=UPI003F79EEBB
MSGSCTTAATAQTYRAHCDTSNHESICTTICNTIATAENSDVEDLDFVLYDHFDPDAIQTLTANSPSTANWEFTITIDHYHITIHNDGEIIVEIHE